MHLNLLGTVGITRAGRPVGDKLHVKVLALLAYLAVENRAHTREALAELFWPGIPHDAARNNLRQSVFQLRQALGEGFLLAVHDTLHLSREKIDLDAAQFVGPVPPGMGLDEMESQLDFYRGTFLDGKTLDHCPNFADWLMIKREACRQHALGLLERLSAGHERKGQLEQALHFARRRVELEPWDEDGQCELMRMLAMNGQTGAALAQFESYRRMLQSELDGSPGARAIELFNRLRAGRLQPAESGARPLESGAERRQVTALYCGFSVSGPIDPEEMPERWQTIQKRVNEIIRQFHGHVAQSHGAAVLGYFGYPVAHEDAARQAVRAALALRQLNDGDLQIRTGLHTGIIITGADLPDAVGLTSALAVRLSEAAHPLLISEATRQLVAGYFHIELAGSRRIEGQAQPVRVHRVIAESGALHRLEAADSLTPFVGRAGEIDLLMNLWQLARQGDSRIALIKGEAGIGKSRLLHTLKARLGDERHTLRELRCFPQFRQSPFQPLIAMIEALCRFEAGEAPQAKFDKLVRHLAEHYPQADLRAAPLLAQLLSLPAALAGGPAPQIQKEKLGVLLDLLSMLAAKQPVLYIIEDLHWIDPSTLELLARFIQTRREGPILILLSARPEFKPPWKAGDGMVIELPPLARDEVAAMVAFCGGNIAQKTLQRIVARTDGIPLYVEEMTRMAQDGLENIPATLHDLLAVKLDGVGAAKRTAQLAATIGREFDLDLLRRISPVPAALEERLGELRAAGLIKPGAKQVFQFTHALIQEAAYQCQTRPDRQAAHRRIAEILLLQADHAQPEIVARHLASCGEAGQAIEYWLKAGKRASQHGANAEAIEHFNDGLRLIAPTPMDARRSQLEFALQVGLGVALHAAQGYSSAQASAAFARAMQLCGRAASAEAFQTIWGIWVGKMGNFPSALAFARTLRDMAEQLGDPVLLIQANYVLGNNMLFLGQFDSSRAHTQSAMSAYRPAHHEKLVAVFGENGCVTSGAFLSWSLWFLGFPDQALQASAESIGLARQVAHPHSLGFALAMAASLRCSMGDSAAASALAEQLRQLADKHNNPFWQATAIMIGGWVSAARGDTGAIAQIEQGLATQRLVHEASAILFLAPLADAHRRLGEYEAAAGVVDQALHVGKIIGDSHFDAELCRLKGECLLGLAAGNEPEAEDCFRHALAVSRRQGAKSLELRAAMSLARHFAEFDLLQEVHGWFAEGFETPDLIEARAMLTGAARSHRIIAANKSRSRTRRG